MSRFTLYYAEQFPVSSVHGQFSVQIINDVRLRPCKVLKKEESHVIKLYNVSLYIIFFIYMIQFCINA